MEKSAQATGNQEGMVFKKSLLFAISLFQFCLVVFFSLLWVMARLSQAWESVLKRERFPFGAKVPRRDLGVFQEMDKNTSVKTRQVLSEEHGGRPENARWVWGTSLVRGVSSFLF